MRHGLSEDDACAWSPHDALDIYAIGWDSSASENLPGVAVVEELGMEGWRSSVPPATRGLFLRHNMPMLVVLVLLLLAGLLLALRCSFRHGLFKDHKIRLLPQDLAPPSRTSLQ